MDVTTRPALLVDKQHHHPRTAVLCLGRLLTNDKTVDCKVLNISAGGAKVEMAEHLGAQSVIMLDIEGAAPMRCEIIWREDRTLGLAFLENEAKGSHVAESVATQDGNPSEQRRFLRTSVLWAGEIRGPGRTTECKITNISAGGAKINVEEPFAKGTAVTVYIHRFGEFLGEVVWAGDSDMGIRFLEPPDDIIQSIGPSLPSLTLDRHATDSGD